MRVPFPRLRIVGISMVLCALAGCAAIFGFDDLTERELLDAAPVPSASAAPDAGPPVVLPTCGAMLPPPSGVSDPGPFVSRAFALDSFHLSADRAASVGLDLDCTTTHDLDASSCRLDPNLPTFFRPIVGDDDAGVDNAGGPFLAAVGLRNELFALARIEDNVLRAKVGLVLEITDLGSLVDSPAVHVQVYPARGLKQPDGGCRPWVPDADAGTEADATPPTRTPSPSDVWCLDDRFRDSVEGSKISAREAWITGGHLHASFDVLPIPITDDVTPRTAYIWLTHARLSVQVGNAPDGGVALRGGQLGGRWVTHDILRQIANVGAAVPDASCALAPEVQDFAAEKLCPARDINASETIDPSAPCDSISLGVGFSAYEVGLRGDFGTVSTYDDLCPAENAADASWDCPLP